MRTGIAGRPAEAFSPAARAATAKTMNSAISYAAVSEPSTMFSSLRKFGTKRRFISPAVSAFGGRHCGDIPFDSAD